MKIKDNWILMGDKFSFHCEDIMTWNKDELKKLIEYIEAYEPEKKKESKTIESECVNPEDKYFGKCRNCNRPITRYENDRSKGWLHVDPPYKPCYHGSPCHAEPMKKAESKPIGRDKDGKIILAFQFVNAIYDYMTCDADGKITISSALVDAIKAKIDYEAIRSVLYLQGKDGFVYTLIAMDDESNPVISDKLAEAIKAKIMPKAASNDKS